MSRMDSASAQNRGQRVKLRKFYFMQSDYRGVLGLELENKDRISPRGIFVLPRVEKRGIPDIPERPRFRHRRREGRLPRDFEEFSDWWLVSDAMKAVLEGIDAGSFAFLLCDLVLENGDAGPPIWLCDVLPIIDAVDESASDIGISWSDTRKRYNLMGARRIVFDQDRVGASHVFRMAFLETKVVCDDVMRAICKEKSIKRIRFKNIISV